MTLLDPEKQKQAKQYARIRFGEENYQSHKIEDCLTNQNDLSALHAEVVQSPISSL